MSDVDDSLAESPVTEGMQEVAVSDRQQTVSDTPSENGKAVADEGFEVRYPISVQT